MTTIWKLAVSVAALTAANAAVPAHASDGVFDFLDPCIEAHDQFSAARDAAFQDLDTRVANVDKTSTPDAYRAAWVADKKVTLRAYFDSQVKPTLSAMGVTDFDKAYTRWFDLTLTQISPDQMKGLQDSNFQIALKAALLKQKAKTADEIANGERELSKSCKMDVGNQALRVALLGAMKPFTFVVGNWKSAEKDGFLAQVVAAPTGINPVDAVRCPIRGCSDKSVVNQALHALGF